MTKRITGTDRADELFGTSEDEEFKGLLGDDFIDGGGGDDIIVGHEGDDVLLGGTGDDRLFGCEDDDILDGGAGRDFLNAGTGNDRLIFTAAENTSAFPDYYDGHGDIDTLVLNLTAAEFARAEGDINALLAFIEATTNANGESGGSSDSETGSDNAGAFFQLPSIGLAVRRIELVEVFVDGVLVIGGPEAVVEDDQAATPANVPLTGSVAENDTVPEGTVFELVEGPEQGTLTFNADGSYSFDPGSDFDSLGAGETASEDFTYRAVLPNGETLSGAVTLTISGVNDAPTVDAALTLALTEEETATLNLMDGASDVDANDVLAIANFTVVSGDDAGLTLSGNTLNVDGSAYDALIEGESEAITVQFDVIDGNGGVAAQTAEITVSGRGAFIAADDDFAVDVGAVLTGSIAENDTVPAGTVFTLLDGPSAGTLTLNADGSFTYDPGDDFLLPNGETASESFSYQIESPGGTTQTATVTLTITGTNVVPTIDANLGERAEDSGLATFDIAAVLPDDADGPGPITLSNFFLSDGASQPLPMGAARVENDQLIVDTNVFDFLNQDETVTIVLTFDVNDGLDTATSQLSLTIQGAEDAPQAGDPVVLTLAESADPADLTAQILAQVSDADQGDNALLSIVSISGDGGTTAPDGASLTAGAVFFDPTSYADGLDDGDTLVVTFFARVDDDVVTTPEDTSALVEIQVTITGEGGNTAPEVDGPVLGSFTEDEPLSSDAGSNIFVLPLLRGATDLDGDELTISDLSFVYDGPGTLDFTVDASNGIVFIPTDQDAFQSLGVGGDASVIYTFTINDGNGGSVEQTAIVTIAGANDDPTVAAALSNTFSETDSSGFIDVFDGASDIDAGDVLSFDGTFTVLSGDASGVTADMSGLFVDPTSYSALNSGESEVIVVSFELTDGQGGSVTQTATITIEGVDDANSPPMIEASIEADFIEDQSFDMSGEDTTFVLNLLDGIFDPDGDTLTISNLMLESPDIAPGDLSFSVDTARNLLFIETTQEAFQFLSPEGEAVVDISFDVSDGNGGMVTQSGVILVAGANDDPLSTQAITLELNESSAATEIDVLEFIFEIDEGDTVSFDGIIELVSGDDSGLISSLGFLQIDPSAYTNLNAGETEVIIFDAVVTDDFGGETRQRVEITINGEGSAANRPPGNFSDGALITLSIVEGTDFIASATIGDFITDLDGDEVTFVGFLSDPPPDLVFDAATGTFSITGANSRYDDLRAGEVRRESVFFEVTDGNGGFTDVEAIIEITGMNDNPVGPGPLTLTINSFDSTAIVNLLDGAIDADAGDVLRIGDVTGLPFGFDLDRNTGEIIFDSSSNPFDFLAQGEVGIFDVTYEILDAFEGSTTNTLTIEVEGQNDAPLVDSGIEVWVAANLDVSVTPAPPPAAAASGDPASPFDRQIDMLRGAFDLDGDILSIENVQIPDQLQGFVFYDSSDDTLNIDFIELSLAQDEVFQVTYDIVDELGATFTQVITINAVVETEAAEFNPSGAMPLVIDVTEDEIVDGGLDLLDGMMATSGSLRIEYVTGLSADLFDFANGLLLFGPESFNFLNEGDLFSLDFVIGVADGQGGHVERAVTLNVTGVNDAPETQTDGPGFEMSEDEDIFLIYLDGSELDVDDADLTFEITDGADPRITIVDGRLFRVDTTQFDYLEEGEVESVVLTVTYTDSGGLSGTVDVTVTVNGVNDAAVQTRDTRFFDNSLPGYQPTGQQNFIIEAGEVFDDADGIDPGVGNSFLTVTQQGGDRMIEFSLINGMLVIADDQFTDLSEGDRLDFTFAYIGVTADGDQISGTFDYRIEGTPETNGTNTGKDWDDDVGPGDRDYDDPTYFGERFVGGDEFSVTDGQNDPVDMAEDANDPPFEDMSVDDFGDLSPVIAAEESEGEGDVDVLLADALIITQDMAIVSATGPAGMLMIELLDDGI